MVMATQRETSSDGSTWTIIDDYGSVYVVLWERPDGRQSYLVETSSKAYGNHAILGHEPLGAVFPCSRFFGIPYLWTTMVHSHCNHTRWKQFVDWGIYYTYSPEQARKIAQQAALKYKAEQAA